MKTITFFGHRRLWGKDITDRLRKVVESNLAKETRFLIGTHGDYDRLALSVCRELRKRYPSISITVIFTSLSVLRKGVEGGYSKADMYADVETMFYEIEKEHFKKQIILSNRKMVDDSQMIICYVDMSEHRSGAKLAVEYAVQQGKEIINLFREEDGHVIIK